jgi:acyl-CoA thioesterase-1
MGTYLALGDSISIDDYTGVRGGGAPSQLARKLGLDLVDLTRDGNTTDGVLVDLARAPATANVVTLTAGGNDLLVGDLPRAILRRLHQLAQRIEPLGARVVFNTINDPSDGDNEVGRRELGLSRLATLALRRRLNAVNRGIKELARERGSGAALPGARRRIERAVVRASDRAQPRRCNRDRRPLVRAPDLPIERKRSHSSLTRPTFSTSRFPHATRSSLSARATSSAGGDVMPTRAAVAAPSGGSSPP